VRQDAAGSQTNKISNPDKLPVQYFLEETSDPEYVDLLASHVPLVSERLKQLFQRNMA
jgi:hypothetical protein